MAHLILWNSYGLTMSPVRPLGCHQLAAWLEHFGYSVQVIDFCNLMDIRDLVKITEKYIDKDTIAIGASKTFWKNRLVQDLTYGEPEWCLKSREYLEKKYPNIKWILGGYQTSKDYQTKDWIEFVGMSEDSLLKFLDSNTKYVLSRKPFDIQTLDRQHKDNLFLEPHEILSLEMSRGCQFKCAFCRYPLIGKKKGTYTRDLSLIKDEILSNYDRYGTTRYTIVDDTVNEDEDKIKGLAEIVQSLPFKFEWIGYLRLDLIGSKKHTIDLYKESGLRGAFFGIESFNRDTSKRVGKGWNGVHGKDFLLELKEKWPNIAMQLGLIAGLPGETIEDLYQTNQWCIDNKIDSWDINALHIDIGDKREFQSLFDKNYQDYGYSFPNPNDQEYWVNGEWNRKKAVEVAQHLKDIARPFQKPGVWHAANLANLGYSFDHLFGSYIKDFDYKQLNIQTREFVKRYVSRHFGQ